MSLQINNQPITATIVSESDRLTILPRVFGEQYMLEFEISVYGWMSELSATSESPYKGGFWQFYTLSNGGFYMAQTTDGRITLTSPSGLDGEMSMAAAGITASLYAINMLCCKTRLKRHVDLYYQLREFAIEHLEWGAIGQVID